MLTRLLKNPRFWLAMAIGVSLLLCLLTPLKGIFDRSLLINTLQQRGNAAVYLFVIIYTIATVLGIPATIFTVAGGAVFGLIWGTLWSVVGATLGAIGAFWVARYLLRDWAKRRFGHHKALVSFNQAVIDKPLPFVLAVRFAPISPFNIVNFLFGLTPIEGYHYTIGTFFGIIPGTIAYTWLGVTGDAAWQGGDSLPFFLALGFLTLLSLLPILVKRLGVRD
ncbi:TVP38/TMEM64 family protein [Limnofasciculus baicalensis]|uniref:TVP38/TMEM64 family membrane protein n=1 Tax=Limnofasciculus baicalensis BBK-W-15 TaxID=2699891 RepID=A0AAE3KMH1_9CYAN|nr:TVP38/TMEM64 family protein [Limnofasciculus baicalensis]MCP2728806.1 TVP38/TMEM64 family protein [Limnofasciculus baicalensis BBK-W-15]